MTNDIRFLAVFLLNIALTIVFLFLQVRNGIDINNTTVIENLNNVTFAMDFVAFIIACVALNILLLSIPSKKSLVLKKALKALSAIKEQETKKYQRHRKSRPA